MRQPRRRCLRTLVLAVAAATAAAACSAPPGSGGQLSPQRRHVLLAYVAAGASGGVLKVLDRSSGRYLDRRPPLPSPAAEPTPSPDGTCLVAADLSPGAHRLALTSTVDGTTSWITTQRPVTAVAWSGNSRRLIALGQQVGRALPVAMVDVRSRVSSTITVAAPSAGLRATAALFGPDGRTVVVAYAAARARDLVAFYSSTARLIRSIPVDGTPVGNTPWSPSGRLLVLLADPVRDGTPPQVVSVEAGDGRVVGRIARGGYPVGWLDEEHVLVAATTGGTTELDSMTLDGEWSQTLFALPADAARPPTVFLTSATGVLDGSLPYAF